MSRQNARLMGNLKVARRKLGSACLEELDCDGIASSSAASGARHPQPLRLP